MNRRIAARVVIRRPRIFRFSSLMPRTPARHQRIAVFEQMHDALVEQAVGERFGTNIGLLVHASMLNRLHGNRAI